MIFEVIGLLNEGREGELCTLIDAGIVSSGHFHHASERGSEVTAREEAGSICGQFRATGPLEQGLLYGHGEVPSEIREDLEAAVKEQDEDEARNDVFTLEMSELVTGDEEEFFIIELIEERG